MSLHIHGAIVTRYGIAANNRGETEGNVTTLQKVIWKNETHSSVSAEAIRFALRYRWQTLYEQTENSRYETNRTWNQAESVFQWKNKAFDEERYIDDDVLGYMDAKAAAAENGDPEQEDEPEKKKTRAKGSTRSRRGVLEVSRAVSLLPYYGEVTFSARGGEKDRTSLYATEMHATAYQYGFSFTPGGLKVPERLHDVLEGLASLGAVGGNHGRFLYDFSPEAVVFRITHDPSPRILFSLEAEGAEGLKAHKLVSLVECGDIAADELVIGGTLAETDAGRRLQAAGAIVVPGVIGAKRMAAGKLGGLDG